MDRYKETFETWNKVAQQYQEKFMHLDLYNDTYDIFCRYIRKKHPLILEIGCGPGNITKYLLTKRPDFRIHAIDVAPNMIALAAQNNPAATFQVMDCRDISSLQNRYDAIISGFCLPYLSPSEAETLIKNAQELLQQDGILYLSLVEGNEDSSGYKTGSSGDRIYFYYHHLAQLKTVCEENHFEVTDVYAKDFVQHDASTETHTIFIAKKT